METTIPTSEITVDLGVTRRGLPVSLDLVEETHGIIAGSTNSGKSQLMYSFIAQLCTYSAVRLVGVDPSRVLLSPLTSRGVQEPLISLGSDLDRHVSVMEQLVREMDRRLLLLDKYGIDKFPAFSASFPLLVVILEEFPGLMGSLKIGDEEAGRGKGAPKRVLRVKTAVDKLVREGRKAGIRLFILAQRPDADIVGGDTRANLLTRLCLRIDDTSGLRMMFEGIEPSQEKAFKTMKPGVGYVRTQFQSFEKFRSFYVGDYGRYRQFVRATDPRYLADLRVDRAFRMQVVDEFPDLGDPG